MKSEFLPYVIKRQFSSFKRNKQQCQQKDAKGTRKQNPQLYDYIKTDEFTELINRATGQQNDRDLLKCYAFVMADGFCYRANNLTMLAESNRQVDKILDSFL